MKKNDIIRGYHPLLEALSSGKTIKRIFIQSNYANENAREIINLARKNHIPFQMVPKEKLNSMTGGVHQGMVALISPVEFSKLEDIIPPLYESGRVPLIVVLDGITDVRNFGAIARSAEFLGVHAVVIPFRDTADINEEAVKASSGALFRMNICREENLRISFHLLKESGIQVIAATEKASKRLHETDLTLPTAIVMGSEEKGISPQLLKMADETVQIPGTGKISSLNVSVAAGIMFYEAVRQRS